MRVFAYTAKDKNGMTLSGILEADVLQEAVAILHKKEFIVVSVRERNAQKNRDKQVKLEDLAIFSRELASMVAAGITLVRTLRILSEQTENRTLALVCVQMKNDVSAGASFYDAVKKHPRVFSTFYIHMVRSGEISGTLSEILKRLSMYLEKSANLQRKVKAAMVYPIVVISMAVIITAVLLIKVVPTFESIFKTLGGELPVATKVLLMISYAFRKFFFLTVAVVVAACFWFKKYTQTPQGRYMIDSKVVRLPVFGPLLRKIAIERFCSTLAVLVRSAVPLLNSLEIVGKASGNVVIEKATENTIRAVSHGESLSGELSKSGFFPPMVIGMIGIGENTGQLSEMLTNISELYEEKIDATVNSLASLLEPLVIGFLGIIIGGIVLALFMPIFSIIQFIH